MLLLLCALCVNALLISQATDVNATAMLQQENGLLENAQLLLLLACLATFAVHALYSDNPGGRLIALAGVLVSFTFIVRESDLRPFGLSAAITWFSDGEGRYVLLTPPWAGLLWVARRHYQPLRGRLTRLLFSPAGAALACSGLLLIAGILLDKSFIRLAPSRYYEELLELNGYVFLLLSALASGGRLVTDAPPASGA